MPARAAPVAVAAPVYSWTGCYIGVGGGYGMFNLDHELRDDVTGTVLIGETTTGGRGWFGTVGVGCDLQADRWVVGIFGDADWGNISGRHDPGAFSVFGLTRVVGDLEQDWAWAAGARIGYLVTPTFLTYFSGGFASTRLSEVDYVLNNVGAGLATGVSRPKTTYNGYFIGGGAEYMLWSGWFVKTEYRFADYGKKTVGQFCSDAATCFAVGPTGLSERTHLYVQTVRTELVWRFNLGGAPVAARY
jgi:outer membrane immunogenic protein